MKNSFHYGTDGESVPVNDWELVLHVTRPDPHILFCDLVLLDQTGQTINSAAQAMEPTTTPDRVRDWANDWAQKLLSEGNTRETEK